MSKHEERAALVRAIEARLIGLLAQAGFSPRPLIARERESAALRIAFPFGALRRSGNCDTELIEIQFDRSGAPRFVLNFGRVPKEGVNVGGRHFATDDVVVSDLPEAYRLYASTKLPRWFSAAGIFGDATTRSERAVVATVNLVPQIVDWFENGNVGPNVKRFGFPLAKNS